MNPSSIDADDTGPIFAKRTKAAATTPNVLATIPRVAAMQSMAPKPLGIRALPSKMAMLPRREDDDSPVKPPAVLAPVPEMTSGAVIQTLLDSGTIMPSANESKPAEVRRRREDDEDFVANRVTIPRVTTPKVVTPIPQHPKDEVVVFKPRAVTLPRRRDDDEDFRVEKAPVASKPAASAAASPFSLDKNAQQQTTSQGQTPPKSNPFDTNGTGKTADPKAPQTQNPPNAGNQSSPGTSDKKELTGVAKTVADVSRTTDALNDLLKALGIVASEPQPTPQSATPAKGQFDSTAEKKEDKGYQRPPSPFAEVASTQAILGPTTIFNEDLKDFLI